MHDIPGFAGKLKEDHLVLKVLCVMQQWSGVNAVSFFAPQIFAGKHFMCAYSFLNVWQRLNFTALI